MIRYSPLKGGKDWWESPGGKMEAVVATEPVEEQVMTTKDAKNHAKEEKNAQKEGVSTERTTE